VRSSNCGRITNDQGNIREIAKLLQPITNSSDFGFTINMDATSLALWTHDSVNSLFNIRDVLIGPINLHPSLLEARHNDKITTKSQPSILLPKSSHIGVDLSDIIQGHPILAWT
jgi:hypothetical protein